MKSTSLKKSGRSGLTDSIKPKGPRSIVTSSLRGVLAVLLCGLVLLLVASIALYATDDPTRFVFPASLIVLYLSLFFGGLFAARLNKGSALLCGSLVAMLCMVLFFVISLILPPSLSSNFAPLAALGFRGIGFVLCLVGAFLGAGEKKHKKKKQKYGKSY